MARSTALVRTAPKATPVAKVPETKNAKFRRLANIRARDAIGAIERLGNLSGADYEYSTIEVRKLESTIREAVSRAISRLISRQVKRHYKSDIL